MPPYQQLAECGSQRFRVARLSVQFDAAFDAQFPGGARNASDEIRTADTGGAAQFLYVSLDFFNLRERTPGVGHTAHSRVNGQVCEVDHGARSSGKKAGSSNT